MSDDLRQFTRLSATMLLRSRIDSCSAPTYAAARRRALLPYAAPKERLPAFRPNVRIPLVPQEQPPKYFVGMPVGHARESSPKKLSAGGTVRKR